jgi:chromosome segregation ATPase
MSKYTWYEIEILELKADKVDLQAQLAQAHRRIAQVEGWLEDKCIELGRLTETYGICHADHLHALKGNEQLERQLAQLEAEQNELVRRWEESIQRINEKDEEIDRLRNENGRLWKELVDANEHLAQLRQAMEG